MDGFGKRISDEAPKEAGALENPTKHMKPDALDLRFK